MGEDDATEFGTTGRRASGPGSGVTAGKPSPVAMPVGRRGVRDVSEYAAVGFGRPRGTFWRPCPTIGVRYPKATGCSMSLGTKPFGFLLGTALAGTTGWTSGVRERVGEGVFDRTGRAGERGTLGVGA